MAKIKIAKIVNKFGIDFLVPIWRAKKMVMSGEIEDFEITETDRVKNFDKPQTQSDFERAMDGKNINSTDLENQALKEQIILLTQKMELEAKLKANAKVSELKIGAKVVVPNKLTNKIDSLKKEATEKGIKFNPNIGVEKLKEKINTLKIENKKINTPKLK